MGNCCPDGLPHRLEYKFLQEILIITSIAKEFLMPDVLVSQMDNAAAALGDRRLRAVAHGRADIAAGRILTPEHIDDWIATLGTGYEIPLPQLALWAC